MSDTQNTYSSSNLYPFYDWATDNPTNSELDMNQLNNISLEAKKKIKQLFFELPKSLEDANKSYLGLTQATIHNLFSVSASAQTLDKKYRIALFDKVLNSGLLDLIEEIGGLREFSRLRFGAGNLRNSITRGQRSK